jgi:hypothetical protein
LEVTRSAANGWHPHFHVLLYFGEQRTAEQVVELTEVIYAAYRRGLERRGFSVARTATRTPCWPRPAATRTSCWAGLSMQWSSGLVEGHIERIRMLKRQMYGRASPDLLRRRVSLAH